MKHISATLLLVILVLFSCKNEETEKMNLLTMGDFEMSTDKITQNEPFTITYKGDKELEESIFFNIVQSKPYAYDLNFIDNKATINIPDSVSAISFHFKTDGKYLDNDKDGYLFPIYNKDGEVSKGANAAIEYHKIGNGGDFGLKGSEENSLKAIADAVKNNPELKENWRNLHIQLAGIDNKENAKKLATSYVNEISSKTKLEEKDYIQIQSIYRTLRDRKLSDSIAEVAITNFPNGKMKQEALMNSFYDAKTLEEKETIFNTIETNYGMDANLTYAATNLASQKFKAGDEAGFKMYADKIKGASEKAGLYNSVAWPAAEKGKNMEMAAQLSKSSLDLLMEAKKEGSNKPIYYTEKQYKKSLDNSYNMYADTYALLQYKLGNVKEAIKYQAQAVADGKSSDVNERYIEFLVADKQYKLAAEKANTFLSEGNGTSKIKEYYKTAYTSVNPEAKDFNTIITGIDKANHDRELAELKESMLDEVAPQFTLKNLDGKDIALADLKGKTVILDFWATWCGPCKASFPGMQEVVEKYKDDESVVLLFVDTFEDGKDREKKVAKFIKDNKYDFHVLIDGKVKDTNNYEVAKKYGITGIPTKIIIGPSGNINFRAVGYSGNNDQLKQEMDMMIDLLKS